MSRLDLHSLLFLCLVAAGASAQQPLPESLRARFTNTFAEEFVVPAGTGNYVKCRLAFSNGEEGNRVYLRWLFRAAGAVPGTLHQDIDVSFQPTAVARRAGLTNVFYVAGWSERTGRVVVESWTLGNVLLAGAQLVGSEGPAVSGFTPPPITKQIEWISDPGTTPPLWDIAFQTYGNTLLLLPMGSPTHIVGLDLDTHALFVM